MSTGVWAPPARGREPAGAGLLGWLADPAAPRLCVITGERGCGKSELLAWLVAHGSRPGTAAERTVHAVLPPAGYSLLGAVWTLADQLGVAARSAGELIAAVRADARQTVIVLPDLHATAEPAELAQLMVALARMEHVWTVVEVRNGHDALGVLAAARPAVMDLDQAQWTDTTRAKTLRSAIPDLSPRQDGEEGSPVVGGGPDPADPVAVCSADPVRVTAVYEKVTSFYGGLREAWLRAGQSLLRSHSPAERALVLLTALADSADPRLEGELAGPAASTAWEVVWRRVRGDVTPPWPGPVLALALGNDPLAEQVLLADHQGVIRTVSLSDGSPIGRLSPPVTGCTALSSWPDGTVWALDRHGVLHCRQVPAAPSRSSGIAALFDDGPTPAEQAAGALTKRLGSARGTALAVSPGVAALADTAGAVHAAAPGPGSQPVRTARLHRGPVTALAAMDLPWGDGDQEGAPLLYSGGADGKVRLWAPDREPLPRAVAERSCPVAALSSAVTPTGPALAITWTDGLIEHIAVETGHRRQFRPGRPARAAVTSEGLLVVGTDESVFCLRPR